MDSLRLTAIRIKDFKSFEGEHEIAGLDRHLTVIVGPNGSGKSNVIDSILFVLGFRAKRMRHTVQTDLIFKDTVRREMCYVELVLSKGQSTYSIRRELYLNKKNKYFLNGEEKKSAEIHAFLAAEGIDMENNRFLILQGEVESISMMKAKSHNEKTGMLEYLEEIIGTSPLNAEIEERRRELERMREESESRAAAAKFYEKEFKYVEDKKKENDEAMQETLRFLNAKKRVGELGVEKTLRTREESIRKKAEVEARLAEINRRNASSKAQLQKLEKSVQRHKGELKVLEDEFVDAKAHFKKIDVEHHSYEKKRERLERQIKALTVEVEDLRSKEALLKDERDSCVREISQNSAEAKSLEARAHELQAALCEIEQKNNTKVGVHQGKIGRMEAELKKVFKAREDSCAVESGVNAKAARTEESAQQLQRDMDTLTRDLHGLKTLEAHDDILKEMRQIDMDLKTTKGDIDATWDQLSKRKFRFGENRKREEQSSESKRVDDAVAGIRGVFGRLRNLGTVDEKYESAISAASKGSLHNIVVDRTETAERCAEVIQSKNLVRTTFMIIDKIAEVPELRQESVPYAFSLVKTDEAFRKCFYYALRDTLVTDSMDDAKKIAFGKVRRRIVTLDGKLIEKSGLMSSSDKGEIGLGKAQRYEKEILQLESAVKEMEEHQRVLRRRREELESKSSLAANKKERGEELMRKLKDVEARMRSNKVDSRELENLSSARRQLVELDAEIGNLKQGISEQRAIILDVYGARYKSLCSESETVHERLNVLGAKTQDAKIRLNEIVFEDVDARVKEIRSLEKEVGRLRPAENYEKKRREIDAMDAAYKSKFSVFEVANEELTLKKAEAGEDYYAEIELKSLLDDIADACGRADKKIRVLGDELRGLKSEAAAIGEYLGIKEAEVSYRESSLEEMEILIRREEKVLKECKSRSFDTEMLAEYRKKKEEFDQIRGSYNFFLNALTKASSELGRVTERRHEAFMRGLDQISKNLKEIYQTITFGGNAELELVDCLDPFTEGVVLSVMPPKKSWKNINNLSGGEKTLASLALVFALHAYKPSPFYVMDEVDAALDFRNVSVVANYIKERTQNVQFIIISLRNDMFELSDTLLGVYKNNDRSRSIVVNTKQLVS